MGRILTLLALIVLSANGVWGQNTNSVASGNWNTASNWSNGVPGNGNTTVNHAMVMDGNISTSGNYTINAPVTDASGGTNYDLTVGPSGSIDVNANVTAEGVFNLSGSLFGGSADLTIRSGDTLTIGYPGSTATSTFNSYSNLYIEAGGVLIIYGNLDVQANGNIYCDGEMLIDGNYHGETANILFWEFPSETSGTGSITTTGSTITDGSSTVFGSTGNCSTGPCSSNGSACGLSNTIASAQSICSGVTPSTLTGSSLTGVTYQWQKSTTSVFTGYSNIAGATSQNLTFSSGVSVTTWYRRIATKTSNSCVNTSSAVAVTVNPSVTASVNISATASTFCSGTSVTFTASPTNGGTPSYQWKKNGTNVGTNSTTYTSSTLANNDVITCVMTSNATCVTGSPATSNSITVTVLSGSGSWTGVTSTNWQTNSNWCSGSRPNSSTNVTINGGTVNNPTVSTNAASCNNLVLNTGATLTLGGNTLTASGNTIINNGATILVSGGTGTFNGNITINNGGTLTLSGGTVTIAGTLLVNNGGTININGGTFNAKGAITNNGTISGSGTLLLNGTSSQTLGGSTGTYGNITLNNSSGCVATGSLTVAGVLTLTSGAFTSNGNLSIDLNTGCIAGTGSGSVVGNINISKTAYSSKYHYISSPLMTGMTVADWNDDIKIKTGTYANLYYYDETIPSVINTDGWTAISNLATALTPLKGYALYFTGQKTMDETGLYTHSATPSNVILTNTVSADPTTDGWNLVGNPYPSTLDWNAASGWTKTGIGNAIYFWDPVNDRYASYVGGIGTNGGTRYIPSMQAFFVRVTTAGGTGTLGMNNNVRVTSTNPTLWKPTAQSKNLVLKVKSGSYSDETVIRFQEDAGNAFDDQVDAYKLKNDGNTPSLYTKMGGDEYSINSLPDTITDITIPLDLEAALAGSYSISAVNEASFDGSFDLILKDQLTNTTHNLREGDYNFNVNAGDQSDRFTIQFKQSATTAVSTPSAASGIQIFSSENTIYCGFNNTTSSSATVGVFNLYGKQIARIENADISSGSFAMPLSVETGIYVVKLEVGGELYTQKVFLK